jgi:hypothetical protein
MAIPFYCMSNLWMACRGSHCLRQLTVFALKGFIENLLRSRLKRFSATEIANANCYHRAKMDIALIAPLSKFQFFQGTDQPPIATEIAKREIAPGCQLPPRVTWKPAKLV